MAKIITLAPHDPLPAGHSIVVMRRFDEDAPRDVMVEVIVTNPDRSERSARAESLEAALAAAQARAEAEGLAQIYQVDRIGGAREQEVLAHGGDHSFTGETLIDDDAEDGVHGPDMRDRGNDGGPRRF